MTYLTGMRWEFLLNAPTTGLLVAAVWYWAQERRFPSILCALSGAVARPLLARCAVPAVSGHQEPLELTVVNVISMSLLQLLLAAYLGTEASWSNWKVDLSLGSLAGAALTVAQSVAGQGTPTVMAVLSSALLAAAGASTLVSIRQLKRQRLLLALTSAALLAALMTIVLNALDRIHWMQG